VFLRERSACPVKCIAYLTGVVKKCRIKKIVTKLTLLAQKHKNIQSNLDISRLKPKEGYHGVAVLQGRRFV
jgi:hypothetical protein